MEAKSLGQADPVRKASIDALATDQIHAAVKDDWQQPNSSTSTPICFLLWSIRQTGAVGHRRTADISLSGSGIFPLVRHDARAILVALETDQADAIWQALFVENTPVSEATRGIIAVLKAFDLPTDSPDLEEARVVLPRPKSRSARLKVFEMAGVSSVVMTNDPLDPEESASG